MRRDRARNHGRKFPDDGRFGEKLAVTAGSKGMVKGRGIRRRVRDRWDAGQDGRKLALRLDSG